MATLLIAEHDDASIRDATAKAMSAARMLGAPVHVLIAGWGCRGAAESAAKLEGAEKVLLADAPVFDHMLAEATAALVASLQGYDAILAPSTANGKNVAPRIAALIDSQVVSDVMKILSPDTFERPIYAGNAIQTVQSTDARKVMTIRTASFQPAAMTGSAPIETIGAVADAGLSTFKGEEVAKSDRPELGAAKIIVSGGRALGSAEKFKEMIEPLADKLGAAMGASRAAVDAGYAPNDWQVGQTGKVVAPDLYIAVGISGAIQHLAGMKDSKIIVAINKDEEAPIFQVADFGLVGDLFALLPDLQAELAKTGR
jgi:electron transfer flavoprotein alpha subunit